MRAFSQKADSILKFLKDNGRAGFETLFIATGVQKGDALIDLLKNKYRYVHISNDQIELTTNGWNFINTSSFIAEHDKKLAK